MCRAAAGAGCVDARGRDCYNQHMNAHTLTVATLGCALLLAPLARGQADTRPVRPPRGAITLFDGKSASAWKHRDSDRPFAWTLVDGAMEVSPGAPDVLTRREFGDFQLHIEFNVPHMPDARGQARGNSGVYLQGRYEVQVLDSYENPTYANGSCGSIYGQKEPDRNVARPPGEWQTYDITFRAPRLGDDGTVRERPRVTLVWNGVKVHDNVEITLPNTVAGLGGAVPAVGPVMLQNHGCKVRYRNIWIKPLKLK